MCVAIALAIAACDSTPPTATLYEPNARWLHDNLFVSFDEPIGAFDGEMEYDAGVLSTSFGIASGGRGVYDRVSEDAEVSGPMRYTVNALDRHGNAMDPVTFEWELPLWTVDTYDLDDPPVTGPLVTPYLRGGTLPGIALLWEDNAGWTGAYRTTSGGWQPLGSLYADELAVGPDRRGEFVLATEDEILYEDSSAFTFLRPDVGRDVAVAGGESFRVAVAGHDGDAIVVANGKRSPPSWELEWETTSIAVSSFDARPVIAIVGDVPIVAFLDELEGITSLRVLAVASDAVTAVAEVEIAAPIGQPAIAATSDGVVVAWNDGGTVAVSRHDVAGWRMWPSPGTSDHGPQLAIAIDDTVVVSLIDTTDDGVVGRTLRWNGDDWSALPPWLDGAVGGTPFSTTLWSGTYGDGYGHAPVAAWYEDGALRLALYNGEAP